MLQLAQTIKHLRTDHNLRIGDVDEPHLLLTHCPHMNAKEAQILIRRFVSV